VKYKLLVGLGLCVALNWYAKSHLLSKQNPPVTQVECEKNVVKKAVDRKSRHKKNTSSKKITIAKKKAQNRKV
jgi:hypothetical protein